MTTTAETPIDHSRSEDAMAFLLGTTLCAFGVSMLTHLGLITGQTAGLAVLLSYVTGLGFGVVFFVANIPFYVLALIRMGWQFTLRTVIAVAMLSAIAQVMPQLVGFSHLDPLVGALIAGGLQGLGLIVLFRHGASLGGVGILALYLQDKTGFRAGWTQLGFDAVLFASAFWVLSPWMVGLSVAGALVINLIIAFNHRHDRYIVR